MLDIWTKSFARAAGVEIPVGTVVFESVPSTDSITSRVAQVAGRAMVALGTSLIAWSRPAAVSENASEVGRLSQAGCTPSAT